MNARMTLIGMENALNLQTVSKSLSDSWTIPSANAFDGDTLLSTIIMKGGQFEPLWTNPDFYYMMTTQWWKKWYPTFEKWATVLEKEYEPLWDRNGFEDILDHEETSGTLDTSTTGSTTDNETTAGGKTSQEKMDDDTTYGKSGSTHDEAEGKNIYNKLNASETNDTESAESRKNAVSASSDKEHSVVDNDGTNSQTTTNSVSAFDSSDWQNHDKSVMSGSHSDDTTTDTNKNSNTSSSEENNSSAEKTSQMNGSESGNGTNSQNVNGTYNEIGNGTDDRTTDYTENTNGMRSAVGASTGTVDTDTTGKKDYSHTLHSWGNWGISQTSQKLLQSELETRYWNIYDHMSDIFLDEMAVRVY